MSSFLSHLPRRFQIGRIQLDMRPLAAVLDGVQNDLSEEFAHIDPRGGATEPLQRVRLYAGTRSGSSDCSILRV
jgi:hypothetical protein